MWYVYIVKCRDNTLYTGITTDIKRRIKEHNGKKGAVYTRTRVPVKLVYKENRRNLSQALKREAYIKNLTRREKLKLIRIKCQRG